MGEKHRPRRLVLEERSVGERRVEWIGEMDLSLWKLFHSYQLGVTLLINLSIPTHPFSTLRMMDWLFTCISDVFDTMSTDSSFHTHSMSTVEVECEQVHESPPTHFPIIHNHHSTPWWSSHHPPVVRSFGIHLPK